MIACSIQDVTKIYGGNTIFKNISFEIKMGDKVGLVGRNGSGKTTLLKLLAGEENIDSGQIHWKKRTQIGYMKQMPDFDHHMMTKEILRIAFASLLQIEQNMKKIELQMSNPGNNQKMEKLINEYGQLQEAFLSQGGYEIESEIKKVVSGLNMLDLLNKQFSMLSGGEKTKVELAYILLKNPDFLLLDEPTNHLDLISVEWLGNFLKSYEGTIIIVSHDRYFLDEMVNKILDLDEGEIQQFNTNYSGYVKEKEALLLKEFHDYQEQQKKIKKMKEAIKRLRDWANRANPPNEGLHKRARNMERALERIEKLNRPTLQQKKMNLDIESSNRSGKDVVILEDVDKGFANHNLFEQVNMHILYGQKVAIVGENGTGKSTLIKLILQETLPDKGEVKVGSNIKIGYLSQHVFTTRDDESMLHVFREEVKVTEGQARQILAKFLFYGHSVFKKISQLSGGEKMRLRLAQLMHQDTNFLILDEPTNHLDIESLEILEEALENYNGTILAVSHDRYFLNKLFERIYWIKDEKVYGFEGNYSWAKEKIMMY